MAEKLKVAVFKLGSCGGCVLQVLNLERELPRLLKHIEFAYFPLIGREEIDGHFHLGLVEGSVSLQEHVEVLEEARSRCELLAALGACACFGGVQAMTRRLEEAVREVYGDCLEAEVIGAEPIEAFVHVDLKVRGCPVAKEELLEVFKSAIMHLKPRLPEFSVCMECKQKEIPCVVEVEGKPCLGPVTAAGCGALCPSLGRGCEGCRGPSEDSNIEELKRIHTEHGVDLRIVEEKLEKYTGEAFRRFAASNG